MKARIPVLVITVFLFVAFVLFAAMDAGASAAGPQERNEPVVIQRIIKIEGTVEKPRVLFIVPRARLWRGGFLNKSFVSDILAPVYPESLIKEGGPASRKGG